MTVKTTDGKHIVVLVQPIKQSITEMLNDEDFDSEEGKLYFLTPSLFL